MTTRRMFILSLAMLLIAPALTLAATKDEIVKRQSKRLAEIAQLKQQGTIGETDSGYLEAVEGGAPEIVEEENSDRRELYGIIAGETSASAEQVARHAAQKNFQRAKAGEFLKYSGRWRKKA